MWVCGCQNQNGGHEQASVPTASGKVAFCNRNRVNSGMQFGNNTGTMLGPIFVSFLKEQKKDARSIEV